MEINAIKPGRVCAAASQVLLIFLHKCLRQSDLCREGKKEPDLPVTTQSVCSCACKRRQALMCACMCRHNCRTSCSYLVALHLAPIRKCPSSFTSDAAVPNTSGLKPGEEAERCCWPLLFGSLAAKLTPACSVRQPASLWCPAWVR